MRCNSENRLPRSVSADTELVREKSLTTGKPARRRHKEAQICITLRPIRGSVCEIASSLTCYGKLAPYIYFFHTEPSRTRAPEPPRGKKAPPRPRYNAQVGGGRIMLSFA